MIPSPNPCTGSGTSDKSPSKMDPFIATPPRKSVAKHSESPIPRTPRSKSTPLRQRFLDEVTMSPITPSTPPRTPSRSPTRGAGVKAGSGLQSQTPKPMLEVGQNGFYFSMEIPEKKIVSRRAATPDAKGAGRVTPSPEKQKRSEVKTGGRVRDILRKNLFGTPTKQVARSAAQGREDGVRTLGMCGVQTQAGESAVMDVSKGDVTEASTTLVASPETPTTLPSQALPSPIIKSGATQVPLPSLIQQQTPQPPSATSAPTKDVSLGPHKAPAASTPFNIGQLMANHSSSKTSKTKPLPVSGLESMPTPLRKMSERLGLRSPHVVRKDTINLGGEKNTAATPAHELVLQSPLSKLDFQTNAAAAAMHGAAAIPLPSSLPPSPSTQTSTTQMGLCLPKSTPISPIISSPHPHTTTHTPSLPSPATPSRPRHPLRTQSLGTPLRLRTSMQSEMLRVQESLKRSLGPDAFQAVSNSSRPGTPPSSFETIAPSTIATRSSSKSSAPTPQPRSATLGRKTPRPISMLGGAPAKAEDAPAAAVPRTTTATRASKPRPKSMIVGSARVLETIASHTKGPPLDSPRERAKQRSVAGAGAAVPTRGIGAAGEADRNKSGGGASTAPEPKAKAEGRAKTPRPQPVVRTTKAAALRAAQHSKAPLSNSPTARPTGPRPRPKSQIFCQPAAPPTASSASDPKPKTEKGMGALGRAKSVKEVASGTVSKTNTTALGRAKSVKAVASGPVSSKAAAAAVAPKREGREGRKERREAKTPEPQSRDVRADSGTGGKYAEQCSAESFTPPGGPTRLPSPVKSPSKTRLDVGGGAPPPPPAPVFNAVNPSSQPSSKKNKEGAQRIPSAQAPSRRVVSGPRIPPAALQIATTPAARNLLLDANALRSPSKEIQNSLDAAIDRKIAEDRARVTSLELSGWL